MCVGMYIYTHMYTHTESLSLSICIYICIAVQTDRVRTGHLSDPVCVLSVSCLSLCLAEIRFKIWQRASQSHCTTVQPLSLSLLPMFCLGRRDMDVDDDHEDWRNVCKSWSPLNTGGYMQNMYISEAATDRQTDPTD